MPFEVEEDRRVLTTAMPQGGLAARGMLWSALAVLTSKASAFIALLIVGWVLPKEDFALYAMATAIAALAQAVQHGGVHKLLIQRGHQIDNISTQLTRFALAINLVLSAALMLAAPYIAEHFEALGLSRMLVIIALALPLDTLNLTARAKLSITFRFRSLAAITSASTICRYALTIFFALRGFGALSFVLPLLASPFIDMILLHRYSRLETTIPRDVAIPPLQLTSVASDARWNIVGALAIALATQGDYLAVGSIATAAILASYFFGFQLTGIISQLFTSGLDSVLLPTFSRLSGDMHRQAATFHTTLRLVSAIAAPLCVAAALALDPLIRVAWAGKWDSSIIVAQGIALSLTTRLIGPMGRTLMQSRGLWKLQSIMLWIDAGGTVLSAALGAMQHDLLLMIAIIAGYRFTWGIAQISVASRLCHLSTMTTLGTVLYPIIASTAIAVFCLWCPTLFMQSVGQIGHGLVSLTVYLISYPVIGGVILRGRYREVARLAVGLRR
jgi:O-antigen/teichoic acid export membrane protein